MAALVALLTVAVLLAAASGVRETELGLRLGSGLPPDSEVQQAAVAADRGFAAGVLAPTIVLLEGAGVGQEQEGLARVEEGVEGVPGVAGVIGPREQPADAPADVFVSEDGNAARLVAILDASPLDSEAIKTSRELDAQLPAILHEAGLAATDASLTGQTAVASDTVKTIVDSSALVGAVVLALNFVLLALFLRALVAPLYLLAASVLSVAATLGLTTYVFQGLLGHSDLTYYVPFAAGVLRVPPGSTTTSSSPGGSGRRPIAARCARRSPSPRRARRDRSASQASRWPPPSPCSRSSPSTDSASLPS